MPELTPATVAVTGGRPPHTPDEPLNVPITMASNFVAGGDLEYARFGNPTWHAFEEVLGDLEGGRCLSYASGMAAVSAVLDLMAVDAKVLVPRHAYNGTVMAAAELESRGRLRAELIDVADTDAVIAACDDDTALVWLESPTNPALEVADIERIAAAAHDAGAYVAVDNTFATPMLQKPLELGADLVVHSATKYLAGHSDLLMGAIVTADDEIHDVLKNRRGVTGNVPGPFETWLALRGMRTLHLRVERAQANAKVLAQRLQEHPSVAAVRYPGFGAIVGFEPAQGPLAADLICRTTALWTHATSLGGVESTLERRRRWKTEAATIPEALIRMSVGIEDVEDLWADLAQALEAVPGSA